MSIQNMGSNSIYTNTLGINFADGTQQDTAFVGFVDDAPEGTALVALGVNALHPP